LGVGVDAGGVGIETGEEGVAAGSAQREGAIGAVETDAAGSEAIDVGRFG